ncbi:hypothetical protein K8I61_11900 [bacterium]|nr:hypothetical protein [bacterium]
MENLMTRLGFGAACAVLIVALVPACLSSGGGGDDDDGDAAKRASCPIPGESLKSVPYQDYVGDCTALGLTLVIKELRQNEDQTIREVRGRYAIGNANVYYLRGAGTPEGGDCFVEITGSGSFAVRSEASACSSRTTVGVLTAADPSAQAFCELVAVSNDGCDGEADDIDDDFDDDESDDDAGPGCVDAMSFLFGDDGCFTLVDGEGHVIEPGELCSNPDYVHERDCYMACYDNNDDCDSMGECLVDNCGLSF